MTKPRGRKTYWRVLVGDHRTVLGFVSAKTEEAARATAEKCWGSDASDVCCHPASKRDVKTYHAGLVYERESLRKAARRLGRDISALEKIL